MAHSHGPSHAGHSHDHDASLTELLDLDGEALRDYWTAALDYVASFAPPTVRRVVDLGAGSGVGSLLLAERFPTATVTAVDVDEAMLARIREKSPIVETVAADLDAALPFEGPVDLAWASMSLHHLADPVATLTKLRATLAPGGIVAVAEFGDPPRFLRPGPEGDVEARALASLKEQRHQELPHLGDEWSQRLAQSGFEVAGERTFELEAEPSDALERYARMWLHRMTERVDGVELPEITRDNLQLRGQRTVTIGRATP